MSDTLFSSAGGEAKYSREDLEAAGPKMFKLIDAAPLTVDALEAALYDVQRAGLSGAVDVTDFVKAKAAARGLGEDPGAWSAAELALVLHLEHLKMTLRERA